MSVCEEEEEEGKLGVTGWQLVGTHSCSHHLRSVHPQHVNSYPALSKKKEGFGYRWQTVTRGREERMGMGHCQCSLEGTWVLNAFSKDQQQQYKTFGVEGEKGESYYRRHSIFPKAFLCSLFASRDKYYSIMTGD